MFSRLATIGLPTCDKTSGINCLHSSTQRAIKTPVDISYREQAALPPTLMSCVFATHTLCKFDLIDWPI